MRAATIITAIALASCEAALGLDTGYDLMLREPLHHARGTLVTSAGVVDLAGDGDGPALEVVHVRVETTGTDAHATTALVSTATLSLPGRASAQPIAANATVADLPVVVVEPGQHEVIDLYFPVAESAPDDARYLFAWTLATPRGAQALRETIMPRDLGVGAMMLGTARYWWRAPGRAWPTKRVPARVEVAPALALAD